MNTLFVMKHSLSCECGEFWLVIADRYDFNFEVEKASTFIKRALHRIYECPKATLHLTREVSNERN